MDLNLIIWTFASIPNPKVQRRLARHALRRLLIILLLFPIQSKLSPFPNVEVHEIYRRPDNIYEIILILLDIRKEKNIYSFNLNHN